MCYYPNSIPIVVVAENLVVRLQQSSVILNDDKAEWGRIRLFLVPPIYPGALRAIERQDFQLRVVKVMVLQKRFDFEKDLGLV